MKYRVQSTLYLLWLSRVISNYSSNRNLNLFVCSWSFGRSFQIVAGISLYRKSLFFQHTLFFQIDTVDIVVDDFLVDFGIFVVKTIKPQALLFQNVDIDAARIAIE